MRFPQLIRQFWIALRLTLRSETVRRTAWAMHWDWLEEAEELLKVLIACLKRAPPAPDFRLRYEGKEMTPVTALRWLAHSFQRELPSLLRSGNPYARAAFQAQVWNLKDVLINWQREEEATEASTVAALTALIEHMVSLPHEDERQAR